MALVYLRLRRLSFLIKARAEERATERVRIARDLHDTLLQSVQGLLISFHLVAVKVPIGDEMRKRLDKALLQADMLIREGRDRVTQLRSENIVDEQLIGQFEAICAQLQQNYPLHFRVERIGGNAALQPHIADEIFNIGREALANAFQHSEGTSIVLTLDYGRRCFVMSCTDDGKGFGEARSKEASQDGHWDCAECTSEPSV